MPCRRLPAAVAALAVLVVAALAPAGGPGGEVLITEFMASNIQTLADEDGDYSDWIEIQNVLLPVVDLDGWYLTDDAGDLTKWRFPSVSIARGEAIVVFASDKNRAIPGQRLHTNFKLDADGEYLALVKPDGVTIAHSYAPAYPGQYNDLSYGVPQVSTSLVDVGGAVAYHVPTVDDAGSGGAWAQRSFDASAWAAGALGAGFQSGTAAQFTVQLFRANMPVWDLATAEGILLDPATQIATFSGSFPVVNFVNTGGTGRYGSSVAFPGTTIGVDVNDFVVLVTGTVVVPSAGTWTFGVNSGDGFSLELSRFPHVYVSQFPGIRSGSDTLTTFELPEAGLYDVRLLQFERDQASSLELFAAPGSFGSFNAGAFDLVGDTASGGLRVSAIGDELQTDVEPALRGVNSSLWLRSEFAVADPPALETLVMQVKYEDGFVALLNGQEVARRNAPAVVEWNSAAASDRPAAESAEVEWIDLSASLPVLEAGPNVLAIHALNDTAGDGGFVVVPRLTALEPTDPDAERRYFAAASPGAANGTGYPAAAGEVEFSQPDSSFTDPLTLTLSTAAPGAVIRYTTNNSDPTESNGTVYSGPFVVSSSAQVRARAFESGLAPGPIGRRLFSRLNADVLAFSSNLPLVVVDTFGRSTTEHWHTLALARIVDTGGGRAHMTDPASFTGATGFKIRGSSSTQFPKKQYSMETWDGSNQDLDVTLPGFPAESDWVLYGPYTDKSLMRDYLAYRWSNSIGRYAARTRFVEVFFDQGGGGVSLADHVGVYILQERVKQGAQRVNVAELSSGDDSLPEISGGYILKKDRLDPDEGSFVTGATQLVYVYPKAREITTAQAQYLRDFFEEFEAALNGPGFADPVTGYAAYIDPDSFVDYHLMVEMTRNIDGFRLSTFMFKDRGGRLNMGPIWDYNLTLGNVNYLEGWLPTGWYNAHLSNADYPWWRRLFQDPEFQIRYIDRWHELRRTAFRTETLVADIDATAQLLDEAQERNYVRWPILGVYVWPNFYIGSTYDEEIAWMRQWLVDRLTWMDAQLSPPPVFSQQGGLVDRSYPLTMTSASGTVYYTLDGSDPRLAGGAVSPEAEAYSGPVVLLQDTRVRARSLNGVTWSALNDAVFDVEPPVYLNELLAANTLVNVDEAGDHDPWIEIYNPSVHTFDLGGYYLTDDPQAPFRWAIPPGTLVCGRSWLLIWADGEPGEGPLHTSFPLSAAGGMVQLSDSEGLAIDALTYPALSANSSFGRLPDGAADTAVFSTPSALTANVGGGAFVFLNEYNAVSASNFLPGSSSDTFWGRVAGNGGDWFEVAVATDHADIRGWQFLISEDTGGAGQSLMTLTLTQDALWSDLRAGTIITVSEGLPTDASYDPAGGDWWINVQASSSASGALITNQDFEVSQRNWQLTIKNALGVPQFGPAGEGVFPVSGVGSDEVCKLEADPSASITPLSPYHDGSSSTFGAPNSWSSGAVTQIFSGLRSQVTEPCTTVGECDDGNPCTTDDCSGNFCAHAANAQSCDDGDACTADDACSGGVCAGSAVPGCCRVDCDCDDGLFCTGVEACEGGVCVSSGDPCAGGAECADGCNETGDHCLTSAGTPCTDDGDACTANVCDGAGQCVVGGDPPACDDADACTIDSCQPSEGCVHEPVACDDGDACTDDSCDVESGCVHEPNGCVGACCVASVCSEVPVALCVPAFVCDVFEHAPEGFTGCFADADGNGVVNPGDRGLISANIGESGDVLVCLYDLDGNGVINAGDRGMVAANIGVCVELPDYQNGSGQNGGAPDARFGTASHMGAGTTCGEVVCP